MLALITTVFVASLLGSLHCAGMCGAFVAFAVGLDDPDAARKRARLHAAYNSGRLVTYVTLGAVFGALGGALDLAGSMVGVSRVAAMVAGAALIVFGGSHLLRALGVRLGPARPPRFMQSALRAAHRGAMALPPVRRALVIGLMTTLLPCGWLYAFVAASAGTGGAATGALTMAVFWVGTLPILVGVGAGVRAISGPLGARLPVVMPLLVIGAGLFTIFSRLGVSPEALARVAGRVETASLEEIARGVGQLDPGAMPCCGDEPLPVGETDAGDGESAIDPEASCSCDCCDGQAGCAAAGEPCVCCDEEASGDGG